MKQRSTGNFPSPVRSTTLNSINFLWSFFDFPRVIDRYVICSQFPYRFRRSMRPQGQNLRSGHDTAKKVSLVIKADAYHVPTYVYLWNGMEWRTIPGQCPHPTRVNNFIRFAQTPHPLSTDRHGNRFTLRHSPRKYVIRDYCVK